MVTMVIEMICVDYMKTFYSNLMIGLVFCHNVLKLLFRY